MRNNYDMQNLFLLTTLVKFEESHGTFGKEWKKNPIVANDSYLNRFEKSCGPLEGGRKKPNVVNDIGLVFLLKRKIFLKNL